MSSHARSEKDGAGQSSNDPQESQYARSSSRDETERQRGKVARGLTDAQKEEGQREREHAGKHGQ